MPSLRKGAQQVPGGLGKFFLIALAHDSLENFYQLNFALMQYHKYSLFDLESMIPYEREIYVIMLTNYLEEERQRQRQQQLDNSV